MGEVGVVATKSADILCETGYLSSASSAITKCLSKGKIPNLTEDADCISMELARAFPRPRGVAVLVSASSYCSIAEGGVVADQYTLPERFVSTGCFTCIGRRRQVAEVELQIVILPHKLG